MKNLRILQINIIDSSNISAIFTEKLSNSLTISNVKIISETPNVEDPNILSISVAENTLNIECQPLTPFAAYFIQFQSTPTSIFKSLNGDAILFEDGVTNKQLILGPIEQSNVVQDFLVNYLRDNIYNITDTTTLVNKIIQGFSVFMSEALYDIRQVKNENYLSVTITDELQTRGGGPFDRLNEESVYEVTRVGRTPTNTPALMEKSFDEFPYYPVSLYATIYNDLLTPDSEDKTGKFNINSLNLNVSKFPVSKLRSVVFTYTDSTPDYSYDLNQYGYQILNSRYDQDIASDYLLLNDSQFRLNPDVLTDPNFSLKNIYKVQVEYEYKNLGIVVNPLSLSVYTDLISVRETLPPIINVFNLKHAPIVNNSGEIPVLGGIKFLDPNSFDPAIPHPAFLKELQFRFNAPPANPGEYSIDYSTGTVYVYGSDNSKNGTTATPPLATYKYKHIYTSEVDYVYDSDSGDIVSLPYGNLRYNPAQISFNYEEVFVPDIDYKAHIHKEVLEERVNNNLIALNAIRTNNSKITDVFRIYNETSGEIYNIIRWHDDQIYFSYNNPPNVTSTQNERVTFENVLNEYLFVNSTLTNTSSILINKILLNNNTIISASEDCIGSILNSSVSFSNSNIFTKELWFNGNDTESNNIDKLTNIGDYQIDYVNGVVYCAVSPTQSDDIGTVSYKRGYINLLYPHIISVNDIYYQINLLAQKNKSFEYVSFGNGYVLPSSFDLSDESFLNNSLTSPYQVNYTESNTIGVFDGYSFVPGVTNDIKYIRSLCEYEDLQNNYSPLNFAPYASFNGTVITYNDIVKQDYGNVLFNGTDYYINVNENIQYLSPNITYNFSVTRLSDSAQLFDGYMTSVVTGDPVTLILNQNFPATGDAVVVNYTISINDLSRVVVDYNKGEYYIDYSYLADEIIVSYEYGDNYLDFRKSNTLSQGEQYYVSYKVGALRTALLQNFGKLINIPILATFNVDLERERYRDALKAALESFIQGPTVTAIKNIVSNISHIEPEIIESIFDGWSLGSSFLNPQQITTTGDIKLIPGKYGNAALVNSPEQSITFPSSSNLRLEKGTLEGWVIPEWNGIDNDADLSFQILKDGLPIKPFQVFVGSSELHPEFSSAGTFKINKNSTSSGTPNTNKDGVFIYYDLDPSTLFSRWFINVVDGYVGPSDGYAPNYNINITSNGLFYDVKSTLTPQPASLKTVTGTNTLKININSSEPIDLGVTFISDSEKYIFDCAEDITKNRFSIYKDPSGYLNFKVFDKFKNAYSISADVSSWKAYEKHHVAVSWKLNTFDDRDEMHLFIDGFEVPNIIKYGNKVGPYLHEKFRTINPEEIAGFITKNIIGSDDLAVYSGSPNVTSSINFSAYNIQVGDKLFIEEPGFLSTGYTISNVNGQTLTLSVPMPISMSNAKYSVNKTDLNVLTEIDIYPNIAVSTISSYLDGYDGYILSGSSTFYTSTINLITSGVVAGNLLRIEDGYFESHYVILSVSANSMVINGVAPVSTPLNATTYHIYLNTDVEIPGLRALNPSYSISKDGYYNNILTINNDAKANDLILIKTLGLNHRRVRHQYYVWGNQSNIIGTKLPTPISLPEVSIRHVLISATSINKNNSTVVLPDNFQYTQQYDGYTSDNVYGRTLNINVASSNLNFTNPTTVTLDGYTAGNAPISETVSFSDIGAVSTTNKYTFLSKVIIDGYASNINKGYLSFDIKEKFEITYPENILSDYPALRYSYQARAGSTLNGSGSSSVYDNNATFSVTDIGNYLFITSGPATGYYLITNVSNNNTTLTLSTSTVAFSNATYQVLNVSTYKSGFQNGYFIFEQNNYPRQPFFLPQGFYEFDYYSYLKVDLDELAANCFLGSDFKSHNQVKAVLDELNITTNMMTDTRIGETVASNIRTITKDFNSIKELKPYINTLMLSHFNSYPFTNDSDFYVRSNSKYMLSSISVNDSFNESLEIENKPLILDNDGLLTPQTQGSIEFWINTKYDTFNDHNTRYYFDASSLIKEDVLSLDNVTLQLKGKASKIISVKLKYGDQSIDYFAGGRIEYSANNAISETSLSISASEVNVSKKVLQVISVKILNDPTNIDYFANGVIGSDKRTLYLGKQLPANNLPLVIIYKTSESYNNTINNQIVILNKQLPFANTPVVVSYVPSGMNGDRISIFKDKIGNLNFKIRANNIDYVTAAPILWSKNTWHRVKATFKVNGGLNTDEMRLFIDGYERANPLSGSLVLGGSLVFGLATVGSSSMATNIRFKDPVNEIFIGSEFNGDSHAHALFNNLRISNISRPVYKPFGESIDVGYNSNTNVAIPVTDDLYTTFLLDTQSIIYRNESFAILRNLNSNNFDFKINVFDSFDIIKNSDKVKEILETLINVLKPANARAFINYII